MGMSIPPGFVPLDLRFPATLAHLIFIDQIVGTTLSGNVLTINSGAGSEATVTDPGGVGGNLVVQAASGGDGNATEAAGAGGTQYALGGDAGADGGGGGAAGGSLYIDGGTASGASAHGSVNIGTQDTSAITIGQSGVTTTVASVVVQAGATLSTTGTGNINLPNNASARFQVEGIAVGATVTAANLDDLTDGSNADTLHTHAAAAVTGVAVAGTTGEAVSAGNVVAWDNSGGSPRIFKADANGASPRFNAVGLATTAAGASAALNVQVTGELATPDATWDVVPVAADVGKRVFMSETAGNLTLTAPTTTGSIVQRIGIVTSGGTGAVKVAIQIGDGVTL